MPSTSFAVFVTVAVHGVVRWDIADNWGDAGVLLERLSVLPTSAGLESMGVEDGSADVPVFALLSSDTSVASGNLRLWLLFMLSKLSALTLRSGGKSLRRITKLPFDGLRLEDIPSRVVMKMNKSYGFGERDRNTSAINSESKHMILSIYHNVRDDHSPNFAFLWRL
eukprot:m.454369 g.454369  ORF g.454369 m.454369 type:complete len:167 (-) comp21569_c0_seq1:162-662(-)